MELKAVRGMRDLFGEELGSWSEIEKRVKSVFAHFGYQEIRTPVLEKKEVFSQTVGDESDIVLKQMYQVVGDKETLVLRPEGTAAFMRAVIEHQLHQSGQPQRYFYYLPMFRHERPQKGRLRQFHQFGAELILDPSPQADVEILVLLDHLYRSFGISEFEIRINSVGCGNCRPGYTQALKKFLQPHLAALCPQCQARFERAPMRILDCKNEGCRQIVQRAPKMKDSLCGDCRAHQVEVESSLKLLQTPFVVDPNIVRGLDYYTRTAFEFTSPLLGSQDALVGGGRYDGLATRFGAKPFPAVGFGLGMERLLLALEQKAAIPKAHTPQRIFFAPLGKAAFDALFPLSFQLKKQGIAVEMNYDKDKNLKALLKAADRCGAAYALILGDEEIQKSEALLKDMRSGEQKKIPLADALRGKLGT